MENYIVYVNLTNINQVKFVKDFNNNYEYKTKLTPNYPALIYFNDGKISDMIEGTNSNKLTLEFMKTVQRVPRSTGSRESMAFAANSSVVMDNP